MDRYLKDNPGQEGLFLRGIPSYVLNEIAPIFQKINYRSAQDLVLFDVGANHGVWTGAFLSVAGHKTSRAELFEPLPGNQQTIAEQKDRGLYGEHASKVTVNPHGISNEAAKVTIHFDTERSGFASMASDVCHLPSRNVELKNTIDVDVFTIDEVCAKKGIKAIDVLKIDIEGFELFALQGADGMFGNRAVDVCLFEFGPHQLAHRHIFKDFYEFFTSRGYDLYKYRIGGAALIPITEYMSTYEMFDRVSMFLAHRKP